MTELIRKLTRVDSFKLTQRGDRGFGVTLPRVWIEDNGLSLGDEVDLFRDPVNDDLIIRKKADAA